MVYILSDSFKFHAESKKYILIGINNIKKFWCIKRKFNSLRAGK